jgi:hypothetical protein
MELPEQLRKSRSEHLLKERDAAMQQLREFKAVGEPNRKEIGTLRAILQPKEECRASYVGVNPDYVSVDDETPN